MKGLVIRVKKKKRGIPPVAIALVIGLIMVVAFIIGKIIEKNTPSKTYVSEDDIKQMYYLSGDDSEIAIVMQDAIVENKAYMQDGTVYLEYNFVKSNINSRF